MHVARHWRLLRTKAEKDIAEMALIHQYLGT